MSILGEGYSRNTNMSILGEGYSRNTNMSILDEGYSRNAPCERNQISTDFIIFLDWSL